MNHTVTYTLTTNEVAEAIRYYLTNNFGVSGLDAATEADLFYRDGQFKTMFHIKKEQA